LCAAARRFGSPRFFPKSIRVTADQFRRLALGLPGVSENAHMGHPDFRVGGKIFATLGPDEARGMVKLSLAQQARVLRDEPKMFSPAKGAWGRQGCTIVCLKAATKAKLSPALVAAWRNLAPDDLAETVSD
jgi:hypothetical protein